MSGTLPAPSELCSARRSSNLLSLAGDFLALTRPRVLMLVLFTAPAAMAMGRDGWPEPAVAIAVVMGTALIGGGCGALNAWIERERDAKMTRTMDRPLPTGPAQPTPGAGLRPLHLWLPGSGFCSPSGVACPPPSVRSRCSTTSSSTPSGSSPAAPRTS